MTVSADRSSDWTMALGVKRSFAPLPLAKGDALL